MQVLDSINYKERFMSGKGTPPLISDFMKIFRDEYGFDTIAIRRETMQYLNVRNTNNLILDVGTGSGWMSIVAVEQGHRVISIIDIDINNLISTCCGKPIFALP